jgi:anti-anti-sigma regulatory factor
MLRITVMTTGQHRATVALEGSLSGPWVGELERSLSALTAERDARAVDVRLDAVTFIDAGGKDLLGRIHKRGMRLVASGCMNRAVVDEITAPTTRKDD